MISYASREALLRRSPLELVRREICAARREELLGCEAAGVETVRKRGGDVGSTRGGVCVVEGEDDRVRRRDDGLLELDMRRILGFGEGRSSGEF